MPSTLQGLAVLLIAFLPGALYVWAFERVVGRWGIGLSDRLLRFVGTSAVFHALAAPATYHVWRDYLRPEAQPGVNDLPLWLWFVALAYVAAPTTLGYVAAHGFQRGWRGMAFLVGSSPAPTAWDAIFSGDPAGWVLMRLKSGRWIGGEFAEGSYAGGYPEPADLFLSLEGIVDPETEDFVRGPNGKPLTHDYGVLVRWEEVEYVEVTPTAAS